MQDYKLDTNSHVGDKLQIAGTLLNFTLLNITEACGWMLTE